MFIVMKNTKIHRLPGFLVWLSLLVFMADFGVVWMRIEGLPGKLKIVGIFLDIKSNIQIIIAGHLGKLYFCHEHLRSPNPSGNSL